MKSRPARACFGFAVLASCALAAGLSVERAPRAAHFGAWGLDLAARDMSVSPGQDFYRYAVGRWLDSAEIPEDRSAWGVMDELSVRSAAQVRAIVEALPASAPSGSDEQKIRDFYRSYLDVETIERTGLRAARHVLQAIDAARSHDDIARLMGRPDLALEGPLRISITLDQQNPDGLVVAISQGGLGLPDREYYLGDSAALAEIREKYRAHIARMLALAGVPDAEEHAARILQTETEIARAHWPAAKRRDRGLTYNPRTLEQLESLAPDFPWRARLAASGLDGQRSFIVRELDAVASLGMLYRNVPVDTWRSYLKYHFLKSFADLLPTSFDLEHLEFHGRTLRGQLQPEPRWNRAVKALNAALGDAVGRLYVEKHFSPESKRQAQAMVENLRAAFAARIEQASWMTEPTRRAALEKLAAFRAKIGYPDMWRDYAALEIRAGRAFDNARRVNAFHWQRLLDQLGKPVDRDEWRMTPQTVNASYNPVLNEITLPAAILQPPFFDPQADPAVNYGGIGGVIGHEMGHGFDDQGSKFDARGVLRAWWQAEDESAFGALGDRLAEQYEAYEALPGLKLNGRLTLGENLGDLIGLNIAYEAYRRSLGGQPAPMLDGLTGDQRFFLSWAQVWRMRQREEQLRMQVMRQPHSPAKFRVNGVVRNMDAWYAAFDVRPTDALYLPPAERVSPW